MCVVSPLFLQKKAYPFLVSLLKPLKNHCSTSEKMGFANRGRVGDKWSSRVLWLCAIGSAIGLYMVAVERQAQNRARMMAEALEAAAGADSGEEV